MNFVDRLKRNLAATWIAHLVAIVIGLFLMPYTLNVLGDSMYGMWIFMNSIACYAGLMYLGMGEMVSRFVATHHAKEEYEELNQVTSMVFSVYGVMGALTVAVAGVLAWIAPYVHDWGTLSTFELRIVIVLFGVNVAIGLCSSVFGGVLMGLQRFDIVRIFATVAGVVKLIVTVLFLQQEWGLLILSLIYLLITLVENVGPIFIAYQKLPSLSVRPKYWRKDRFKECFSFSTFTFLESIAFQLIYTTDTVVIGLVFGNASIVPYFVASRLVEFIIKPIMQIGSVSMPQAGALHVQEQRKKLHELIHRSTGLAFLLTTGFFIGAGWFGKQVIETWVGSGYDSSHLLLMVLLGAQLVALPISTLRQVLFGMGHVKFPAMMYFVEAIANLALTLTLIKPLGLLGVAIGTAVPLVIIECGIIMPYAFRRMNLTFGDLYHGAVKPYLSTLVALVIYSWAVAQLFPGVTGWLAMGMIAGGGGLVLAASWWVRIKITHRKSSLQILKEGSLAPLGNDEDSAYELPEEGPLPMIESVAEVNT